MLLENYLCMAGVEIANSNRTLAYVNNELGANFGLADCGPVTVIPASGGYADEYSESYEGDFAATVSGSGPCGCRCDAMDDEPGQSYVTPVSDDAPWFQEGNTASSDFLGLLTSRIELLPTSSRGVTPRGPEAAIVGRMRPRQRVLSVEGLMFAKNQRGMYYGERWLADALRGTYCDDCAADEAIILPYCPAEDEDDFDAFRRLARVGLVDGPVFTPRDPVNCRVQEVSFQLAAGWPYVMSEPLGLADVTFEPGFGSVVSVLAPAWVGDVAMRFQVTAASTGTVFYRAVPMNPDTTDCPFEGENAVWVEVALNRDDVLIVDSSIERAVIIDATSKREISALSRMTIRDGLVPWVTVPPCSRICFHFGGHGRNQVFSITREP